MSETSAREPKSPGTGALSCVARAIPRVAGVVVSLVVMTQFRHGWLLSFGVILFVLSVPPHPIHWWRYLRTGKRPLELQVAPYSEPGDRKVDLQRVGEDEDAVVRAVCEISGLRPGQGRQLVRDAPCPLLAGVSRESAERTRALLAQAGATVHVGRASGA